MKRDVIGVGACPHCGTPEELKVDRGRQVYLKCFGIVTGKRCGFQCTWPTAESTAALAEAARVGWLGPIPYGYFPPVEQNSYAANLKGKDHEKFRDTAPYEFEVVERGQRPKPRPAEQPEPAPRPEPEPIKQPEPKRADPGTEPRRRFRLGGGR